MKSQKVITTLVAIGLTTTSFASGFRDYIVKEGIYTIVAETDNQTVMIPSSDWFQKRRVSTLKSYCSEIGGMTTFDESILPEVNKAGEGIFSCTAPNAQGFKVGKYSMNKGTNDNVVIVTHESKEPTGYAMKSYIKEQDIANKKSLAEFNSAMLDFGVNFYDYYAYCGTKGGEYLISNVNTGGKAIKGSELLLKGYENGKSSHQDEGTHYCINTVNPTEQFTVKVSRHPFNGVIRFQPSYGVDKTAIQMYNDPLPWYTQKATVQASIPASVATTQSNNIAMTTAPSNMATSLAMKTFSMQDTTLERQSGIVMEGMYLGSNSEGCYLAAVAKSVDRPLGHKYLYGKGSNAGTISNFKQCGEGAPVEFIGESFERSFPQAIEAEYGRTLNMCKIRGGALSSQLGYDITCRRLGEVIKPAYEMTIVKKDKLVLRAIEQ